jgi:hypothetical protein
MGIISSAAAMPLRPGHAQHDGHEDGHHAGGAHHRAEEAHRQHQQHQQAPGAVAAVRTSQSPMLRATPVRARASPMTNMAPISTMFGLLKPARASFMVSTPVKGSATSMIKRHSVHARLVDGEHQDGRAQQQQHP